MICRCGHGQTTHRVNPQASQRRRRLGFKPTLRRRCYSPERRADIYGPRPGFSCPCRDWHPKEVKQ